MNSLFSIILLVTVVALALAKGIFPVSVPSFPTAIPDEELGTTSLVAIITFAISLFIVWAIVRYETLHDRHDHHDGGPQRFHSFRTPRLGGVALYLSMTIACIILGQKDHGPDRDLYTRLVVASIPAFIGGLMEDLGLAVGVLQRLLLTMASGVSAVWLISGAVNHLGLPMIDQVLQDSLPLTILVSSIAVGGLANATNIIDGFNGLASGTIIIIALAFGGISFQVHDALLFKISLALAMATLGFIVWNWPKGRIFLGDGGAYFSGFVVAEIGVLLVHRHPEISPWCVLLVLIHPVVETLLSMYRRLKHRDHHPGLPDRLHFHQLVYARFLRGNRLPGYCVKATQLARNSSVSLYFWAGNLVVCLFVQLSFKSTELSLAGVLVATLIYLGLYRATVHFKVPKMMISKRRPVFILRAARTILEEREDLD